MFEKLGHRSSILVAYKTDIIELLSHCIGGYFNIHIRGRGLAVSSAQEGKSEASSTMQALSSARYTGVGLYTLRI